jgi:uncharacterized phage-related protein lin1244/lin1753
MVKEFFRKEGKMKEQGIPYFPLDVELDEKFRLIEAEYGLKGWATVVKLFQKIYGEFGYYCSSTTDMMLLFANGIKASYSFVLEITKASIKRGIFDKDMYEKYQILTSKGIQKRYFKAVSRRKHIEVDKRYLLIDIGKIQEDVNKNGENVNNFSKNASNSQQSIVEENLKEKYKKRKGTEAHFTNEHKYTSEECASMIDDIMKLEI